MLSLAADISVSWLGYPLAVLAVSLGLSRLVPLATRRESWPVLDLPLGFAMLVIVTQYMTATATTARFTGAVTLGLAVLGLVTNHVPWRQWLVAVRLPFAAATAAYLTYLAPVLASGRPTFAGWIKLDDGASFMGFADQLLAGGRTWQNLPPSTFEALLQYNFDRGYPMGAFTPFGTIAQLVHIDVAWIYQPHMALLAGLAVMTLFAAFERFIELPRVRALYAFLAVCSSLLVGFAWWGGVKELTLVPLLILIAVLLDEVREDEADPRQLVGLAIACAAFFAVFSPIAAAWLAAPLAYLYWRFRRAANTAAMTHLVRVALTSVVLALPTFLAFGGLSRYMEALGFAQGDPDIGNLTGPLNMEQIAGVWPVGDFRDPPVYPAIAAVMVAFVVVLAGFASWRIARSPRRGFAVVALSTAAIAVATSSGNAWINAKSLAVASPLVLALGYIGIATLLAERRFPEFYMSSAVVSVGVVWSLLLAYHEVNLAPYQQLKELELIGDQYGGLEPTLMIEYSPYAVRHFLRRNQAEGAGELRVSPVTMADGTQLPKGEYADIDEFALPSIMAYQTLVLRRSPVASRPPANYVLQGQDRFYEVWQVGEVAPIPTEHIPLGDQADPTGTLSCVTIRDKADEATRTGGRLAAVVRPQPITVPLTGTTHPADWTSGQRVVLRSSGTLTTSIDVAAAGEYEFWLRGWVRGTVRVLVDGVQVGQLSQQLNQYENYSSLGVGEISAGRHELQLEYSAPWFAPGVGGSSDAVDPLVMSPVPTTTDVVQVPAADYQSLCGKQLDWLEVVH